MKNILLSLILIPMSISFASPVDDGTTIAKPGDKAPGFTCNIIDGGVVDISKLRGKIIMITFFATWCGPCNLELPHLQETIWKKFSANEDFRLVVIGREHTKKELLEFASAKKLALPFAPDPDRAIYSLYASKFVPRNVLIGRDGRILYNTSGFDTREFGKIDAMIAEELKKK